MSSCSGKGRSGDNARGFFLGLKYGSRGSFSIRVCDFPGSEKDKRLNPGKDGGFGERKSFAEKGGFENEAKLVVKMQKRVFVVLRVFDEQRGEDGSYNR